jgi:uncharacterized protein YkwD
MKKIFLFLVIIVLTLPSYGDTKNIETLIIKRINQLREQNNKAPLVESSELSQMARLQSEYIASNLIITHSQTDPNLSSISKRAKYLKINKKSLGENILNIYLDTPIEVGWQAQTIIVKSDEEAAKFVVLAWSHSEGHFKNLLDSKFQEVGISVEESNDKKELFVVAVFGSNN